METLRLISEQKIPRELERMDSFAEHFATSLDSVKVKAAETAQCHGKLWKLKSTLRDAEDEFVKVLSVKTRKEARQMALIDSINAVRNRLEELRRNLQIQTSRRDDYAGIISQLSLDYATFEYIGNQNDECRGETQEALSWYNRVLGFQIECGRVLACDPQLNDTKELLHELNRTNGLFKFVRTMRERFQEVAAPGSLYQPRNPQQELSTISASAPAMSVSTNQSESSTHKEEYSDNAGRRSKKVNRGRVDRKELLSPESVRRSPRFKTLEQVRK
ncbi:Kinetochore protein SPC25 homolog [Linum perenne]